LISLGLAIGAATDPTFVEPFVNDIDYVQFMGIATIGKQGQPFDPRVVDRIRTFKKKHPDIPIQVDGGVTLETAPALLDAGADRLIVGHALRDAPDIRKALAAFNDLTEKYGLYK
jgi:ribulose-phosphate 3-epimerase